MNKILKISSLAISHLIPLLAVQFCRTFGYDGELSNYIDFYFLWTFLYVLLGLRTEYQLFKFAKQFNSLVIIVLSILTSTFVFIGASFFLDIWFALVLISSVYFSYWTHVYSVHKLALGYDQPYLITNILRSFLIVFCQTLFIVLGFEHFLLIGHLIGTFILGTICGFFFLTEKIPDLKIRNKVNFKSFKALINWFGFLYYGLLSYIINIVPLLLFGNFDPVQKNDYYLTFRILIGGGLVISAVLGNEIMAQFKTSMVDGKKLGVGSRFFIKKKLVQSIMWTLAFAVFCFLVLFNFPGLDVTLDFTVLIIFTIFLPRLLFSPFSGIFEVINSYKSINWLLVISVSVHLLLIYFEFGAFLSAYLALWLSYAGMIIFVLYYGYINGTFEDNERRKFT